MVLNCLKVFRIVPYYLKNRVITDMIRENGKMVLTTETSAEKFVNLLLTEGSKVSCDETNNDFDRNNKLPHYYDEDLYKKGQQFYHKHVYAMFGSKLLGLLAVLAIPTILKVLIFTQMSGNRLNAYRRYVATLLHMVIWYDKDFQPGSKLWKSICEVRNLHNSASKRSCKAGFYRISQKDMALTQFGFMGFAVVRSEKVGILNASEEELKAFIHLWRTVGYIMGIEDRFNICQNSVKETKEICNLLLLRVFRPEIEQKRKDFLSMSKYLTDGLKLMEPIIQFKPIMCILHIIVQENYEDLKPTYFQLNFFEHLYVHVIEIIITLLRFDIFRWYLNSVRIFSVWMIKTFPILPYLKFGVKKAYVDIKI